MQGYKLRLKFKDEQLSNRLGALRRSARLESRFRVEFHAGAARNPGFATGRAESAFLLCCHAFAPAGRPAIALGRMKSRHGEQKG